MAQKKPSYAQAIEELEAIVAEIESEGIDVDVLAERVKRAAYLIALCKGKLRDTEVEVRGVLAKLEAGGAAGDDDGEQDAEDSSEDNPEDPHEGKDSKGRRDKGGSLF